MEKVKEEAENNKINNNQNTLITQEIKEKEKNICNKKLNLYLENEEFLSQIIQNKQSLYIDCEIFFKLLCHCDECSKQYEEIGMNFIKEENAFKEWSKRITYEEKISDENFINKIKDDKLIPFEGILQKILEDFFRSNKYKQLPVEYQILMKVCIAEMKEMFQEFLLSLDHNIITLEDIYTFINKYKDYFESLKNK